jgi:flagellar P-ring protein precursor FlgI
MIRFRSTLARIAFAAGGIPGPFPRCRRAGRRPASVPAQAAQALRNLVSVEGVRENPLVGYGLVVGLNGSGDSTQVKYSSQSVVNMLKQFGVKLPEGQDAKNKNVAAVMVSAVFPPGYRRGQAIDVTVSSLGDAKSLRGGTLLLTQLRAADNEVYALAQGNLVVGGLSAPGKSGSSVTVNTPTGGRIPNGAQIEREIADRFRHPPAGAAAPAPPAFRHRDQRRRGDQPPLRPGRHHRRRHQRRSGRAGQSDRARGLRRQAGKPAGRSRRRSAEGRVQLAHRHRGHRRRPAREIGRRHPRFAEGRDFGKLERSASPARFSKGQTAVTPQSKVSVDQGSGQMFHWPAGAKLQTIIDVVNSLGASPDDIMAILQALDQAGAIEGELVVI